MNVSRFKTNSSGNTASPPLSGTERSRVSQHAPCTLYASATNVKPEPTTEPERIGATALVGRLSQRIQATLDPIARGWSHCVLIDFPNHSNVGDNAIWLGEIAWLAAAGIRVDYRCDVKSYNRAAVAQALADDGVIFIHGGGNLGDLWQRHQRLRETVIRDFPDRPIVQFPQTIHFRGSDGLARARAVFDAHSNLTLLVRDRVSLDIARNEFRATSILCPDMAFFMGPLARPRAARADILWLRRQDIEAAEAAEVPADASVIVADWIDQRRPLLDRARTALRPLPARLLTNFPSRRREVRRLIDVTYDWQAQRRVDFGCRLLASGRVVITDRLHAHILCLLLGIPHVVLDNSYGKLRHFRAAWDTTSSPLVRWAESPAAALASARALLADC
jgi:exopolysaccharide biosynthesis predicted pyruvyltransferase EpsI